MAPRQPLRAIARSTLAAVPIGAISGGLIFASNETEPLGIALLLALPFVSAFVAAWYVHAVEAMLIAAALTAIAFLSIGWLCDAIGILMFQLPLLGAALVAGAVLGLLVRAFARHAPP